MQKIRIEIERPAHAYEIIFDPSSIDNWRKEIESRIDSDLYIAFLDTNLAELHGWPETGEKEGRWRYIRVEPGEENKTFSQYQSLCESALATGIDRKSVLVAVGGGVTGDIGGFIAATLMRGIRLIQVPTTLLAQVDSSVGGKNGINAAGGKNLVGTFHQPELVLILPAFLNTLPRREYLAGVAEMVKTAILDSRDFFNLLRDNVDQLLSMDPVFLTEAIARTCNAKAAIVAADEREAGRRALLNLGHTFGHAFEALAGYDGRVVHGEAVAAGTVLAAVFSAQRLGLLPDSDLSEILDLLAALDLPIAIDQLGADAPNPPSWQQLLANDSLAAILLGDKKSGGGKINLILPHAIGDCQMHKGFDAEEVACFMREEAGCC